jgi:folate-binding protein YgfZ
VTFVLRRPDHLLLLTGGSNEARVAGWIDFYTIIEDTQVEDITAATEAVSLMGPKAPELLAFLAGPGKAPAENEAAELDIDGVPASAIRRDLGSIPAFDLITPGADARALKHALVEAGACPVGSEAVELARVEQGVPALGRELSESYNPLEAGLQHMVSYTKGCYIGQEVIARLTTYDKVQKRLVCLAWHLGAEVDAGAKLMLDGKQAGVVTSAVRDPRSGNGIGLGYVRKALAGTGTQLTSESGAQVDMASAS